MLDLESFENSLKAEHPPTGSSPLLQALWWDANDNWEEAHRIAQNINSADGSRVHAYLHRKEGDEFNAGYWYSRAGQPKYEGSLHAEWQDLARSLLTA